MGIITTIDGEVDEDEGVYRVFVITHTGISTRATLNRVAARAAGAAGVGQRALVASAYDEEGIDLVWNKGLGHTVPPEEKFTDAKRIDYHSVEAERASRLGEMFSLPSGIKDKIDFDGFRPDEVIHVWEIPLDMTFHS